MFRFYLDNNKIKFIDSELFKPLSNLLKVQLKSNVCINEDFLNPTQIATLQNTVKDKCSIDEPGITIETIQPSISINQHESELEALRQQIASLQAENLNLKDQLNSTNAQAKHVETSLKSCEQDLSLRLLNSQNEIANSENIETIKKLQIDLKMLEIMNNNSKEEVEHYKSEKIELKADKVALRKAVDELKLDVKAEKSQCQKQLNSMQEFHQKLELQWNSTCILEKKELNSNLELKLEENGNLLEKLQKIEANINEKNEKIEQLEKKIQALTQY